MSIFAGEAADRRLILVVALLMGYVALRTTFVPVMQLGFFGDDFIFLNWTSHLELAEWLRGFLERSDFNLTYRPLATVIYLVYRSGSPAVCYSILALLFVFNIALLFSLYRRLLNVPVAASSMMVFSASFIYFDATHRVYNLITQVSTAFLLAAVHLFLSAGENSSKTRAKPIAAYVFYILSLWTYEITLFGFAVLFALALWQQYGATPPNQYRSAIATAIWRTWFFGTLSAIYLAINFWSPIRTAHLQDHAIPLSISTIPLITSRAWAVLKNTLAWIASLDWAPDWTPLLSVEFAALAVIMAIAIAALLIRSVEYPVRRNTHAYLVQLCRAVFFGGFWFVVFLLPGSISSYFDYRMTFLAYAGFSLFIGSGLSVVYGYMRNRFAGESRFAQRVIAGALSMAITIWLMSNLSLLDKMNNNLVGASGQQREILQLLRPYLTSVPADAVIVVRIGHAPNHALPYPYQALPFAEDYAFAGALKYFYGKRVADASMFFDPQIDQFKVGRFSFAQKVYAYGRLVLFEFAENQLVLRTGITVEGKQIDLPLAAAIANGIRG